MDNNHVVAVLNHLLAIHHRSLAVYLQSAKPWTRRQDEPGIDVLTSIAGDHLRMVDRVGAMIVDLGGAVRYGEIPMRFAEWHDLSVRFILDRAIECQELDIQRVERCVQWLDGAPLARALAEEALGEAKAHLELLQEAASLPAISA